MSYRVLVVDDSETTNAVVTRYLQARGLDAESALTGRDAVARCNAEMPDAVLMDIQMPAMDGFETTRRIRALPEGRRTLIIAFTALAMPGDRERCLAAGMDDYISKPVRMSVLHDRVIALIERSTG